MKKRVRHETTEATEKKKEPLWLVFDTTLKKEGGKMKKIIALMILVALTLNGVLMAQEKHPMTFVDVVSLKSVSSPRLSPDGRQILFTQSKACWKENKSISHIYRIQTNGTGLIQMTNGKDGESGGVWSPDGQTIAFTTRRGEKESQIFFLNNGGGEAIQFTEHEGGVSSFEWSRDGKKIYFVATDPKTKEEKKKDKVKDDAYLFEQNWQHRHLWVIDVDTKEEKRITDGAFTVRSFALSRDGTNVVYSRTPTPLYDDVLNGEIYVMDLADGSDKRITENKVYESNVALSPDNRQILFVADANANLDDHYYQSALFLVPAAGGKPELVLPDFKPEMNGATWSSDGKAIYFTANMGVHVEIFSLTVKNKKVKQLTSGAHSIGRFDYVPRINTIAYFVNSPQNPGILWISKMKSFSPKQVFDPFVEDLKGFELARVDAVQWKSTDGQTVEGILTYPIGYEEGKSYPLLADTHGGPASSDKLRFGGYHHARAGRGYAILEPNYRGSTGYGNDVLRDMVGHYFLHADDDVMTGVEYLVDKGFADPEKLGTMGWSAGGHMTNWLVTETDRFKAASSGAGAANWISMYSQSDVRIYRTPWFLGDPWQADAPLKAYRENSPIFRIHRAKTPTLIFVGKNDPRVPMPQSVEMYRGLKANGVPTELIIFPRSGHGPRELRHRLYKMNKEFQWLEKYITGKEFKFDEPPEVPDKEEDEEGKYLAKGGGKPL